MDEKILKEMAATMREIKEQLAISSVGTTPGSASLAPEWQGHLTSPIRWHWLRGPVADPQPWILLDKPSLARLKIQRLDTAISEMQKEMDSLKLERDLLKREYKIK